MDHAYMPIGPAGKPTELHLPFTMLTFNFTKYPQACKALTAFMLEADQFNPWVTSAKGYLSHFLNAYDNNPIWTQDPKNTKFRDVAKRTLTPGGLGSLGETPRQPSRTSSWSICSRTTAPDAKISRARLPLLNVRPSVSTANSQDRRRGHLAPAVFSINQLRVIISAKPVRFRGRRDKGSDHDCDPRK
jgi:hypothetical protein